MVRNSLKSDFIDWLLQLEKDNGKKRYTKHTVNTYIDRISFFCSKFFSCINEEPLKQMAQSIEIPMMCCCLCESFQEKDEQLKEKDVQLLARVFLCKFIEKQKSTMDNRLFRNNPFEEMMLFLIQKKSGKQYQCVIRLLFKFLKQTNWNNNYDFYKEIADKIKKLEENKAYLKYGYIEATQTTPAIIIPKAGQDYISIHSLQEIFGCDRRTILGMIEKGQIGCCHHRKKLKNISNLNDYFKKCHSRICKNNTRETKYTKKQEEFLQEIYKYLEKSMQHLMKKDFSLSKEDQEKQRKKTLNEINSCLVSYEEAKISPNLCWESSKKAAERIGKTIRTAQRQAKDGKILTLKYFKGKTSYFAG